MTHNFFMSDSTSMAGETLPAGAVSVARACESRFTVEGTAPDRLLDLFKLHLMAGHDSLAHAALERRLALAKDTEDRARVLQEAIGKYLRAEPARIAAAESTIARMDALGTHWQARRVRAHAKLLELAMYRRNEQYMQREAEKIIALGKEVPAQAIIIDINPFIKSYTALGEIAYIEHPDSLVAVMTRAKQDLSRFPPGTPIPSGSEVFDSSVFTKNWMAERGPLLSNFKLMSLQQMQDYLVPVVAGLNKAKEFVNKPLPPLAAKYWFPKPPDSWPPGNGHASLIIYGGLANSCAREHGSPIMFSALQQNEIDYLPSQECDPLTTTLPHWVKQYGDRLSITIVAQTQGGVSQSVLTPAARADNLKWYFLDHLKLPVTLGVMEVDSVWRLPAVNGVIDGREFYVDTNYYEKNVRYPVFFGRTDEGVVLFYDEHGALRYVGRFDARNLQRLIDLSMGAPAKFPFTHEKPG